MSRVGERNKLILDGVFITCDDNIAYVYMVDELLFQKTVTSFSSIELMASGSLIYPGNFAADPVAFILENRTIDIYFPYDDVAGSLFSIDGLIPASSIPQGLLNGRFNER